MAKVAIVTDSGSGITLAEAKEMGIGLVSIPFMFGDNEKTYFEDINLTRDEFFDRLKSGETVHTSQPSPVDVLKVWDQVLENNDSLVYIPMSSGLSGSCQSAMMLSGDYDGKVEVVNNQRISVTQKRSVLDAMEMVQKGWTAKEINHGGYTDLSEAGRPYYTGCSGNRNTSSHQAGPEDFRRTSGCICQGKNKSAGKNADDQRAEERLREAVWRSGQCLCLCRGVEVAGFRGLDPSGTGGIPGYGNRGGAASFCDQLSHWRRCTGDRLHKEA